ncbi:MAG: beta-ketoacyl-ACP synthase III [Thermoleophilia bacterium]
MKPIPVKISSVGTHVPDRIVTNDDLSLTLDTSDEWISTRSGIRERRIAADDQAASDLGAVAAARALEAAGVRPSELDLIITASLSPDMLFPATASFISGKIGADGVPAFDLSAACTGFIYALATGSAFIASGQAEKVLVVGADVVSKMIDWTDRSTAVLFGDGAGAVLLEPAESEQEGILGFDLGNDPSGAGLLSLAAGGSRLPASRETVESGGHFISMNGREVYKFAARIIVSSARKLLGKTGYGVDEVDLFVPHQANIRIIDAAAGKLGIPPERVFTNLERYGNTSCASIPLCIDEAVLTGRLGATAGVQGKNPDGSGRSESGSNKLVLMVGFGGGLSWGSCLARTGDIKRIQE